MREFTHDECLEILRLSEIPDPIRRSSSRVAAIFTQSWCGDWRWMRRYLKRIDDPEIQILCVEYDGKPFFDEMKRLKEQEFGNGTIPYVRFYRDGELFSESNLIWRGKNFLKLFEKRRSTFNYR